MTPDRWEEISRIFNSARELEPEARAEFLIAECGEDQNLREQVQRLIESDQKAADEEFIERPAVEGIPPLNSSDEEREEKSGLQSGFQLGAYRIIQKLGEGGMGEVYLAEDTRLGRQVALKILPPDVATDTRRMQRFRQEARVASSLNQPNILTVFEFGEINSLQFLATEYVDGETLRSLIRTTRLSLTDILEISIQIVAALDAAHEAKIVHRDMKPENVMIRRRDRVVKVLDFGLAKLTEPVSTSDTASEAATEVKTAAGHVLGTVNYMSPEQAQGHRVNERSDVWSAGVIVYEMVARHVPFKGMTPSHTIVQILEKDPPRLTSVNPDVPVELERIVHKALAKRVDERYQTSKDMLIDLRNLKRQVEVRNEPVNNHVREDSSLPQSRALNSQTIQGRPASGRRMLLAATLSALVLFICTAGLLWWKSSPASMSGPVATSPLISRELTYSILVQRYRNGKPFKEAWVPPGDLIYEADDHLRLQITPREPGYLYVLNEGPTQDPNAPQFLVVFPSVTSNRGSSFVSANQQLDVPEQTWLRFDKERGTEKLWLVWSTNSISALDEAGRFASERTAGVIDDRRLNKTIKEFLAAHAGSQPLTQKSSDRTQTIIKSSAEATVYLLQLEHH